MLWAQHTDFQCDAKTWYVPTATVAGLGGDMPVLGKLSTAVVLAAHLLQQYQHPAPELTQMVNLVAGCLFIGAEQHAQIACSTHPSSY